MHPVNKKPVFYISRMLPAYRLDVFEHLNKALDNNLIVCHGQAPQQSAIVFDETQTSFKRIKLKNYWIGGEAVHFQFYKSLFKRYGAPAAILVEESPRSVTLPFLLRYAHKKRIARILWGHFYSINRTFDLEHPLQRHRIKMATKVEACITYGMRGQTMLRQFIDEERVFLARNTLHIEKLFTEKSTYASLSKQKLRESLGLPGHLPTFCFSGQLLPYKGVSVLIRFFEQFTKTTPASLVIIGDGNERAVMEDYVNTSGIQNVFFLGSIPKLEHTVPYFLASDMMVVPGALGLVVNHAFGLGLPVLSQLPPDHSPYHGPESENIIQEENGLMVEWGNLDALVSGAHTILADLERYSMNALHYAEEHLKLEKMVNSLVSAITYAQSKVG